MLSRLNRLTSPGADRVYGLAPDGHFLHVNLNQLVPYPDILGYGSLLSYPYADLVFLNTGGSSANWADLVSNHQILSLLNVRYLVADSGQLQELQRRMPISIDKPVTPPTIDTSGPNLLQEGSWKGFGPATSVGAVKRFAAVGDSIAGILQGGFLLQKNSLYELTFDYRPERDPVDGFGIALGPPNAQHYAFAQGVVMTQQLSKFGYLQRTDDADAVGEIKIFTASKVPFDLSNIALKRISGLPLAGSYYQVVEQADNIFLLENQDLLPHAFFVRDLRSVMTYADARAALWSMSRPLDLRKTALVEGMPVPAGQELSGGEVQSLRYEPNRIRLRTRCDSSCYLVVTDRYYPGWTATIDGKFAPIYPTDAVVRGVLVPAGEHNVEFQYFPKAYIFGFWVSGLSILVLLLVTTGSWWRGRNPT